MAERGPPTTLKFKQCGHGEYIAKLPSGNFYRVKKIEHVLLGGRVHASWSAELVADTGRAVGRYIVQAGILIGSKYFPNRFRSRMGDTKKLAVIACQAHADGAGNEEK